MGIIRRGVPKELVLFIQDIYHIRTFVETGTYYGETASWASLYFKQVITIEYAYSIYAKALESFGTTPNISFVFGDSRQVLNEVIPNLNEPAIFWLDDHYSGQETYGKHDECPLIDELKTFHSSSIEHFILIDDARLFMAPPPEPHKFTEWPTITEVLEVLLSINRNYHVTIFEDVIIAVPPYTRDMMVAHFQQLVTRQWEAYLANVGKTETSIRVPTQKDNLVKRIASRLKKQVQPLVRSIQS